ncbi:MAG: transcription elongation factor Spt5 [Desulfurococcaceae archaeon]
MSTGISTSEIYAVRTTSGRELDVAFIVERRIYEKINKGEETGVSSILVAPGVRGFVFIETRKPQELPNLLSNIKYASTQRLLKVSLDELLNMIKPKALLEEVNVGDEVEITRGPFRGMRAKVVSIDKSKNTLTVNLLEAAFSIPITIPINYVRKKGV